MSEGPRQSLYVGDGTTSKERGVEWPELLDRMHLIDPRGYIADEGLADAVNVAIQRLLRIGLMEMVSPDTWLDCTGDMTNFLDGIAYEAVWGLSERARKHAIGSRPSAPDRLHEFSSTTLAVDQRKLPEALRILTRARNEVLRVLSESDRRDQVYHLDISLIPLTGESHSREEEDRNE